MRFLPLLFPLLLSAQQITLVDQTTQKPLANAEFIQNHKVTYSDENGSLSFTPGKTKSIHVKAYGYRPFSWDVNDSAT